ncbi:MULTISPECIES: hypothetical protein [unclassified Roseibium]|nr:MULTISPECIES: hypothetical protein [unclassified Roseibium]
MARTTGSPVKDVESWEIDDFLAYAKSAARVISQENKARSKSG